MLRVILESPFSGDQEANIRYARDCMRDSLERGESPFASHLLYTQVLDDTDPAQREQGINAGFAWHVKADKVVVYGDRGISKGMREGIINAKFECLPIELRFIDQAANLNQVYTSDAFMALVSGGKVPA